MFCSSCGAAAQPGQKFCTECGAAIAATAPAAAAPAAATLPPPNLAPPATPASPTTPVAGTDLYEPTAALNVVEQTSPTGYDPNAWNTAEPAWPAGGDTTGELPAAAVGAAATEPFRITPLVAVSALAAVLAVAAAFVDIASYEVTGEALPSAVTFALNDFASNLTVGAIIAALLLVGGSALGATGRRIGTGLAGGAGLALAGMFGMVIGQVTRLFDGIEVGLLSTGGSFTLTTTQEVGFWLAAVAAVLGGVAFILSFAGGKPDGRPPLNPAIGILGALGTLAVVVGPLIPLDGGSFGDNFSNTFVPPATLYLRLLVLVLIGVGGLVGFLANRRWGIGMALGAISIGAWQWVTAITESGDLPLGIAGGNPGGDVADPFAPHIVTTVGVVMMLLAVVAGLVVAGQQRNA